MPSRRSLREYIAGVGTGLIVMYLFMSNTAQQSATSEGSQCDVARDSERNARVQNVGPTANLKGNSYLETTRRNERLTAKPEDEVSPKDEASVAAKLFKTVRVLCWVMTSEKNLYVKAIHVQATWTRHCNVILFASDHKDDKFPTIDVNVTVGRSHLTAKTMKTFDYIYKHHYNDADWFMKADDDTFVILENLRYFLSSQNTSEPVYFGHTFPFNVRQGYNAGGAGYVLSREAVRRLSARPQGQCMDDHGSEDVEIGRCLEAVGVKTADSRDAKRRSRFHPTASMLSAKFIAEETHREYGVLKKLQRISDYAISFHKLEPYQMYTLEYLVYGLKLYGGTHTTRHVWPEKNKRKRST